MAVAAAAVAKVPLVRPGLLCASRAHIPPFLRASFNLKPTFSFLRSISSLPNSKFSIVHYHGSSPSLPSTPRRSGIENPSDIPIRRCFSTIPSAHVSESGSIGSPLMQSMENKIKEHLNAEVVTVRDAYGDGRHVSIDVVSSAFEGESVVNRQRMVYKAIWEELQSTVHAVDQMTTRTPTEAAASSPK